MTFEEIEQTQERMGKVLAASTDKIAKVKFGVRAPQPFIMAVKTFLEASPPTERAADQHYINKVYTAITSVQTATLLGGDVQEAKQMLVNTLYDPERERNLAPGMQTPKVFADAVERITQKEKDKIMGTGQAR